MKRESEVAQCPTPSDPMDWPPRLLHPWDFLGKSTGVGCHCLLQEEDYISSNYLDVQIHVETAVNVIKETFLDLSSSLTGSSMACY